MNKASTAQKPTHEVFVVEGEGQYSSWTRIGAAWPHKDGDGYNMQLQAMPLSGRLVVRRSRADNGQGEAD